MSARAWMMAVVCLLGCSAVASAQDGACVNFSQQLLDQRNDTCADDAPIHQQTNFNRHWGLHAWVVCQNSGWKSGGDTYNEVTSSGTGECGTTGEIRCPADFHTPTAAHDGNNIDWAQDVDNRYWNLNVIGYGECKISVTSTFSSTLLSEACNGTTCCDGNGCTNVGEWDPSNCRCVISPIIIDLTGVGIELTDVQHGVRFDLLPGGRRDQVSWTRPHTTSAWLALDRNGNGKIDDGSELFGSVTDQPQSDSRNGFAALAVFDDNHDGKITPQDGIFDQLVLWQDKNHNGRTDAGELIGLKAAGIAALDLGYRLSRHTDAYGNRFRYRARVEMTGHQEPRWAWDVFLVSVDPEILNMTNPTATAGR